MYFKIVINIKLKTEMFMYNLLFLRRKATKKVVRQTEILIYKFLSNDVE
jgi:hypothetical protein